MKDRWSQLSMSEKSDLMSLYIRNGISSLEEIKKHYNSFATGGQMDTDESKEDGKKDNPPDLGPNSFAMRQIGDWLATRPMSRLENVDTKIRWRLTPQQQAFKKEYDRLQAEEEERRVQARQQADQKLRDDLSGKNGFWNMVGAGLTRAGDPLTSGNPSIIADDANRLEAVGLEDEANRLRQLSAGIGMTGLLGMGFAAAPMATTASLGLGYGVDKGTQLLSNNKYTGWGNMLAQNVGGPELLWDLTNPGYFVGGWGFNRFAKSNLGRALEFSRELNKGIRNATRYGDIRVSDSYFHNPESAYRATTQAEVEDLRRLGHTRSAASNPNAEQNYTQGIGQGWLKGDSYMQHVENSTNRMTRAKHENLLRHDGVILETSEGTFTPGYHGKLYGEPAHLSDINITIPEKTFDPLFGWGYRRPSGFALEEFPLRGLVTSDSAPLQAENISYFTRGNKGQWIYNGRVIPEKRILPINNQEYIPTLDQAMQETRNARIEVPEVLSAKEPFEMSDIHNWRELFSNYNPNTNRTVRTTTQSTEFNPNIFDFNKGNTDTRFEFFEPWKFINYDLTKMSTDEIVKTFGPKAKHLKELYDVAAANNFEGKYADIAKDVELKLSKMFAIDPKDVDIAAGLARAKGIYNIPEYTERFKKYGDLGETFIQDAKNRLDNIQLQGVSRNFKMIGQHGVEGGASTTPHPIHPTITLSNNNRSSVIREFTTHEANHASHGTTYQPKWMEIHNEKIRPVPKKNREDFTNFDKYLDEMDELVERSKTAVEYAHETRLEGETLDQALDRVFESANRDVYNSEIPSDIRQMVKNYTKDSVLKFWKQFLGGLSIPIGVGISNSQSQSN